VRKKLPPVSSDDNAFGALIALPDGTVLRMAGSPELFPIDATEPISMGETCAASFCLGAMHAGLSAEQAVRLALRYCIWIGGDVQVERVG
jgi:hypothetical protein